MSRDMPANDLEASVLSLLLSPEVRGLLSCDEIVREMGQRAAVLRALDALHRKGLINRIRGYAFTTRAARRFDELRL